MGYVIEQTFKPVECLTGLLDLDTYREGKNIQLTFKKPAAIYGEKHLDACHQMGYWFLNLTKEQSLKLAEALIEIAEGTREVKE